MPATKTPEVALGAVALELRGKLGLSQEKFAHRVDLSTVYVSEIERGRRSPSLHVLFKIAAGCGVSASRLIQQVEKRIH